MTYTRFSILVSLGVAVLGTCFDAQAGGRPVATKAAPVRELLYVGTRAGCNAGVVTMNPRHLGCTTQIVGYSMSSSYFADPAQYVEIFIGVDRSRNLGVVTSSFDHMGGRTQSIGYLSIAPIEGIVGVRLYKGVIAGCNAGVVTTNPSHMGCVARHLGYAYPRR